MRRSKLRYCIINSGLLPLLIIFLLCVSIFHLSNLTESNYTTIVSRSTLLSILFSSWGNWDSNPSSDSLSENPGQPARLTPYPSAS